MFLLVAHFRLNPVGSGVPPEAAEPLTMLAASPECRSLRFARSTNTVDHYVLVAEFLSAPEYRRALAPWPMRTVVVPWLSTAQLEVSEVSEVLFSADGGELRSTRATVPDPGR